MFPPQIENKHKVLLKLSRVPETFLLFSGHIDVMKSHAIIETVKSDRFGPDIAFAFLNYSVVS